MCLNDPLPKDWLKAMTKKIPVKFSYFDAFESDVCSVKSGTPPGTADQHHSLRSAVAAHHWPDPHHRQPVGGSGEAVKDTLIFTLHTLIQFRAMMFRLRVWYLSSGWLSGL